MTNEELQREIYERCPDLKRIKPNPNHFPIITKYNNRIERKYRYVLFDIITKELDARILEIIGEVIDERLSHMAYVNQMEFGDSMEFYTEDSMEFYTKEQLITHSNAENILKSNILYNKKEEKSEE